jgi:hypothetical protein
MPTNESQPASWFPWVIVLVLGYMLWNKQDATPVPPQPVVPTVNVETAARKLIDDTANGYARVFSEAATKVQSKELITEEALANTLKTELKDVREKSSSDFDKLLDGSIPTEFNDGNRGAVSTFLERAAKGFMR